MSVLVSTCQVLSPCVKETRVLLDNAAHVREHPDCGALELQALLLHLHAHPVHSLALLSILRAAAAAEGCAQGAVGAVVSQLLPLAQPLLAAHPQHAAQNPRVEPIRH
eukprot:1186372-Rhodomonas_salina.1